MRLFRVLSARARFSVHAAFAGVGRANNANNANNVNGVASSNIRLKQNN